MRRACLGILVFSFALLACGPKGPPESISLDADADWLNDPPPDPGPTAPATPVICGEVRLSAEVASSQPTAAWSGAWLLLYASTHSGRVVAGFRAKLPSKFPVPFCVSQKNVIAPGAKFAGSFWLTARIDADGQPALDPGDFDGTTRAAVPVGTRGAVVTIDTFR